MYVCSICWLCLTCLMLSKWSYFSLWIAYMHPVVIVLLTPLNFWLLFTIYGISHVSNYTESIRFSDYEVYVPYSHCKKRNWCGLPNISNIMKTNCAMQSYISTLRSICCRMKRFHIFGSILRFISASAVGNQSTFSRLSVHIW